MALATGKKVQKFETVRKGKQRKEKDGSNYLWLVTALMPIVSTCLSNTSELMPWIECCIATSPELTVQGKKSSQLYTVCMPYVYSKEERSNVS